MALKKCKECGKEISTDVKVCPNCGKRQKRKTIGCGGCLFTIIVLFIISTIIMVNTSKKTTKSKSETDKTRQTIDGKLTKIDLSKFKSVGYYKKKLSSGSYKRVFSVYVSEVNWAKMEEYGRKQMYTQGGTTSVFFFNDLDNTPDVTFIAENFDTKYEKYWIALYVKGTTGEESFAKYPAQ